MFNQKAMSPLEIFVKLVENKRKFPNTINFILEHVDPESNIYIVVSPSITYNHLMPIHLAAFYGLYEATQKLAYFWYGSNTAMILFGAGCCKRLFEGDISMRYDGSIRKY